MRSSNTQTQRPDLSFNHPTLHSRRASFSSIDSLDSLDSIDAEKQTQKQSTITTSRRSRLPATLSSLRQKVVKRGGLGFARPPVRSSLGWEREVGQKEQVQPMGGYEVYPCVGYGAVVLGGEGRRARF